MRDTDIAYAAGFFDGEGSVVISYSRSLRIEVSVSQKHSTPLVWFRKIFGGSIYQSGNYAFQWKVFGRNAIMFLMMLQPYLIEKAVDAEEAMSIWSVKDDPITIRERIAAREERRHGHKETTG